MPCGACGSSKPKRETFVHTDKDGNVTSFQTEAQAKAAKARRGGSYVKK